jgi:hypothetical protein
MTYRAAQLRQFAVPYAVPLKYLRIEQDTVVIRRWPRRERRVPRGEVDRFDVLRTKGEEGVSVPRLGIRGPHDYLALLLKDGSSIRVAWSGDLKAGALRLNNELGGV